MVHNNLNPLERTYIMSFIYVHKGGELGTHERIDIIGADIVN